MLMDELYWNETGRNVFFLENPQIIEAILKSKIKGGEAGMIIPPKDSFQIVPPKGVKGSSGIEIPTISVTWMSRKEQSEKVMHPCFLRFKHSSMKFSFYAAEYPDEFDANKTPTMGEDIDQQYLCITFVNPVNKVIVQHNILESQFMADLNNELKLEPDINPMLLTNGDYEDDEIDDMITADVVKLVLGFALYLAAGGTTYRGIPKTAQAKVSHIKNAAKSCNINSVGLPFDVEKYREGGIRGFHYRNLRDSRYYQNEYKDYPKDSRWTWVRPYWVGEKINSSTTSN